MTSTGICTLFGDAYAKFISHISKNKTPVLLRNIRNKFLTSLIRKSLPKTLLNPNALCSRGCGLLKTIGTSGHLDRNRCTASLSSKSRSKRACFGHCIKCAHVLTIITYLHSSFVKLSNMLTSYIVSLGKTHPLPITSG